MKYRIWRRLKCSSVLRVSCILCQSAVTTCPSYWWWCASNIDVTQLAPAVGPARSLKNNSRSTPLFLLINSKQWPSNDLSAQCPYPPKSILPLKQIYWLTNGSLILPYDWYCALKWPAMPALAPEFLPCQWASLEEQYAAFLHVRAAFRHQFKLLRDMMPPLFLKFREEHCCYQPHAK